MGTDVEAGSKKPVTRGSKGGRTQQITIRLSDAEWHHLQFNAMFKEMSAASYLRACALGAPGAGSRRQPRIDTVALGAAVSALNKVGSNINQLAREKNFGTTPSARAIELAMADLRTTLQEIRAAARRNDDPQGQPA